MSLVCDEIAERESYDNDNIELDEDNEYEDEE